MSWPPNQAVKISWPPLPCWRKNQFAQLCCGKSPGLPSKKNERKIQFHLILNSVIFTRIAHLCQIFIKADQMTPTFWTYLMIYISMGVGVGCSTAKSLKLAICTILKRSWKLLWEVCIFILSPYYKRNCDVIMFMKSSKSIIKHPFAPLH